MFAYLKQDLKSLPLYIFYKVVADFCNYKTVIFLILIYSQLILSVICFAVFNAFLF